LADHVLFRHDTHTRAVVNLGGFANFTWLPPSRREGEEALRSIRGGDICVCNQLLDTVSRRCFHKPYDKDGKRAMRGEADEDAHNALLAILKMQAEAGRSLGNGDELTEWVDVFFNECTGHDLARTAALTIGQVIANAVGETDQVVLAGGGTHNQALRREITDHAHAPVCLSDDLGAPAQYREAIAMAILGGLCADRVPITLPQITGCPLTAPVAGCWIYP
ncbi:MAG: anhydro-N-acetylmuramic acid kinase, partial [Phycisphaeraceae bacterium]